MYAMQFWPQVFSVVKTYMKESKSIEHIEVENQTFTHTFLLY